MNVSSVLTYLPKIIPISRILITTKFISIICIISTLQYFLPCSTGHTTSCLWFEFIRSWTNVVWKKLTSLKEGHFIERDFMPIHSKTYPSGVRDLVEYFKIHHILIIICLFVMRCSPGLLYKILLLFDVKVTRQCWRYRKTLFCVSIL